MIHHDEPVAELLRLVHVVRRQHERDAALLQPEQAIPDHVPGLRVEARRRLVEEQQLGIVDERARDRQTPLHPARERLHLVAGALGELDEVEQLVDLRLQLAAREPEVAAVDEHVLAHRQLRVERVVLRNDAEPGSDAGAVRVWVETEDAQRPAADRRDAADHPHRRALAGAVRPEEAERLAAPDVEVDSVDRDEVAEPLHEAASVDHCAVLAHGAQPTYAGRTAFLVASTSRAICSISSCSLPNTCSSRSRSHSSTTSRRP